MPYRSPSSRGGRQFGTQTNHQMASAPARTVTARVPTKGQRRRCRARDRAPPSEPVGPGIAIASFHQLRLLAGARSTDRTTARATARAIDRQASRRCESADSRRRLPSQLFEKRKSVHTSSSQVHGMRRRCHRIAEALRVVRARRRAPRCPGRGHARRSRSRTSGARWGRRRGSEARRGNSWTSTRPPTSRSTS